MVFRASMREKARYKSRVRPMSLARAADSRLRATTTPSISQKMVKIHRALTVSYFMPGEHGAYLTKPRDECGID